VKKRVLAGAAVCLMAVIGPASNASAFAAVRTFNGCSVAGTSHQKYTGTLAWADATTGKYPSSKYPTWNCSGGMYMAQVYWHDRKGANHFSSKLYSTSFAVSNGGVGPGSPNTYDGHLIYGIHGFKARGKASYLVWRSDKNMVPSP
jgi:hypothetical protein